MGRQGVNGGAKLRIQTLLETIQAASAAPLWMNV